MISFQRCYSKCSGKNAVAFIRKAKSLVIWSDTQGIKESTYSFEICVLGYLFILMDLLAFSSLQ